MLPCRKKHPNVPKIRYYYLLMEKTDFSPRKQLTRQSNICVRRKKDWLPSFHTFCVNWPNVAPKISSFLCSKMFSRKKETLIDKLLFFQTTTDWTRTHTIINIMGLIIWHDDITKMTFQMTKKVSKMLNHQQVINKNCNIQNVFQLSIFHTFCTFWWYWIKMNQN